MEITEQQAIVREKGMCGEVSPGEDRICIRPQNEPHSHEWGADDPIIRYMLLDWIKTERANYADVGKYAPGSVGRTMLIQALKDDPRTQEWYDFIFNYVRRSQLLGLDTQSGRQLMGKAIIALMHCLETACYVYGDMPKPGLPSGEVEPWLSDNLTWDDPAGYVPPDPDPAPEGE